jgi:hypothetical protein
MKNKPLKKILIVFSLILSIDLLMSLPIQAQTSNTNRIEIIEAKCGSNQSWKDVTKIVQSNLTNNSLRINWQQPYREIGGDPAFGKVKVLLIVYRLNGDFKAAVFQEENPPIGLRATIP